MTSPGRKSRKAQVYQRRPGGSWRLVREGREDLQRLWVAGQGKENRATAGRFVHGADFLVVPLGADPTDDMEPTLSIPPVSAD